jgi:hypothetical protein
MKRYACVSILASIFLVAGGYTFEAVSKKNKKRSLVDYSQFVSRKLSRKSVMITNKTCDKHTTIFKGDSFIILSSERFGPLPVRLSAKNPNGEIEIVQVNEDNLTTIFKIPVEKISNGTKIQVTNAFDDTLFCTTIDIKERVQAQ